MNLKAKLFIGCSVAIGTGVACFAFSQWHSGDLRRFVFYVLVAMIASGLKVILPGINGTMSVNFLFILIGVLDMTFPETVALGCAAALVQSFYGAKSKVGLVHLLFNLCNVITAIGAAFVAYHGLAPLFGHSIPLMLTSAAVAYFLFNTAPVSIIISLTENKTFRKVWSECYFWSFPYYLVGAGIAGAISVASRYIGWATPILVLPIVYWIYRSYRLYLGRLEDEKRHVEDMAELHLRTIEALALAIEAKDQTTHDHLQRVRVYALEIGKELKLNNDELEALRAAALLHDIGKLAVPEHIINKPGRLTSEEFEKVKIHPVVGAEILQRVNFPYAVVPIVLAHHESWDGNGYPYGLKGEAIPIGARILSAVDCLDALSSDRQYRRALPLEDAMQMVVQQSGIQFDPAVVDVLKLRYRELERMTRAEPEMSIQRLSTDVKIDRGDAPAAGFANIPAVLPVHIPAQASFLSSIAAARQEAQTLFELSHDLGKSLSLDETLSVFSVRLKKLVPFESVAIFLRRENRLVPTYVSGENFRQLSHVEVPLGQGITGWVALNEKPIINGNPAVDPGYLIDTSGITLRSALSVPLASLDGTIGVLTLYRAEPEAFTRDHLRILLAISAKLGMSIQNAVRFQLAEDSATTDYLTGLPNARSLFLHLDQELARCKRANSSLAVMVCDLDGFKQINDRLGHLEGNKVLRLFADSLRANFREYDYVARMGGDEFVIVVPGLAREIVEQKAAQISQFATLIGQQVMPDGFLSGSVGTAFYREDGEDAEELLAESDRRMYIVKQIHHEEEATLLAMRSGQPYTATIN